MSAERPRFSDLPSIDRILQHDDVKQLIATRGRDAVKHQLRELLDEYREQIRRGRRIATDIASICAVIAYRMSVDRGAGPRPVINLSGTLLHTNLGRATLPQAAIDAAIASMSAPSDLEYDLASGQRGERDDHVESLLCRLTGAEAATVVNNNAAAVLLALNSLAPGREVLVSRGELVEIGGSFRVPDIITRAGARLREVGTTNRTRVGDFTAAIDADTAMVLKVHPSNYVIEGFTACADERELAAASAAAGLPFVVDLGSGTLIDLADYGLPSEPTPQQALGNGADLVTFSGDKLLGGPQAGIVVGRRELVDRLRQNPMKRALRCDKTTIAALAAVLRLYLDPENLPRQLPVLRRMLRPVEELETLGAQLLPELRGVIPDRILLSLTRCRSQPGSGALPGREIESVAIELRPRARGRAREAELRALERAFRALPTPVIGRLHRDALLFDLRGLDRPEPFVAQLAQLPIEP